jgi:hypothetical protein
MPESRRARVHTGGIRRSRHFLDRHAAAPEPVNQPTIRHRAAALTAGDGARAIGLEWTRLALFA